CRQRGLVHAVGVRRDEIVLQPLGRHDREERGRGAGAERGREGTHPGGDELGTVLPARCSCHPADHGASTHAPTYAKERTRHPPKVGLTRRPVRLSFWTRAGLDKTTAGRARLPRPVRAVSTMRLRRGESWCVPSYDLAFVSTPASFGCAAQR